MQRIVALVTRVCYNSGRFNRQGETTVKKTFGELLPDLVLIMLVLYVCLLGVATVDELMGWGFITPYFK